MASKRGTPSPYLDPNQPALTNTSDDSMTPDAVRKTLSANGIKGKDADTVISALPATPRLSQVRTAMARYKQTEGLKSAGYSEELVRAVGSRLVSDSNMTIETALADVDKANPDIRTEAQDAAKAAGVNAPGGADDEFGGTGTDGLGQEPDTAFLNALRAQSKQFLTAADLQYLASVQNSSAWLDSAAAGQQAALANQQLVANSGALTEAGVPQAEIDRAMAQQLEPRIPFTEADITPSSAANFRMVEEGMRPDTGGKTVTEAIRHLRDMSPDDLRNLQQKLVSAGYYAQIMPGGAFEPDVWGDPTDPATNEAWKTLLRDTIAQKSDVQSILAKRSGIWSSKLDELRQTKTEADAAKADAEQRRRLADALQRQVTVTDKASLRSAAQKIGNQQAGFDILTPAELNAMAEWVQGIQAQTQTAAKQGASVAYDVDPTALIEERIKQEHPVEVLGARAADVGGEIRRLLAGPSAR